MCAIPFWCKSAIQCNVRMKHPLFCRPPKMFAIPTRAAFCVENLTICMSICECVFQLFTALLFVSAFAEWCRCCLCYSIALLLLGPSPLLCVYFIRVLYSEYKLYLNACVCVCRTSYSTYIILYSMVILQWRPAYYALGIYLILVHTILYGMVLLLLLFATHTHTTLWNCVYCYRARKSSRHTACECK